MTSDSKSSQSICGVVGRKLKVGVGGCAWFFPGTFEVSDWKEGRVHALLLSSYAKGGCTFFWHNSRPTNHE